MSFLNLNDNISRLRKEKGITQEALAEFVGVTKASVSKWETGITTPDIQLIPVLAAFFDVSVDELLGYEAQLSTKQIRFYYHKLACEFAEKEFDAVWEESKALVKKYYGCYEFLMQMVTLWINHASLASTESRKEEVLEFAEKLCTRVEEGSSDAAQRENASSIRGLIWLQQGRSDLLIESMEKDVLDINRVGDKGSLLTMAYLSSGKLDMAEKSSQIGLYRNLMGLMDHCIYLLMCTQKDEASCRSIIARGDQVLEVFQIGKLHPNVASGYHYQVALSLCTIWTMRIEESKEADLELEEEIYQRIEKYIQMVRRLCEDGIKTHADDFFYLLNDWFDGLELGTEGIRDKQMILQDVVKSLEHPTFLKLPNRKRMEKMMKIVERLRETEDIKEKNAED
jgi:transcriptional regulator with XRE-family HTH domain